MAATNKLLRPARLAVLECLQNWDGWTQPIKTFASDDHEVKQFLTQEPQTSRCPFLAVTWLSYSPLWQTHLMQRWPSVVFVSIWVPVGYMTLAEDLVEDAVDAVFRSPAPGSSSAAPLPLLRKRLGDIGGNFPPDIVQMEVAVAEEKGLQQQHKLLRSSIAFNLKLQKDPLLRAS